MYVADGDPPRLTNDRRPDIGKFLCFFINLTHDTYLLGIYARSATVHFERVVILASSS